MRLGEVATRVALAAALCFILKSSIIKREPGERRNIERHTYDFNIQAFNSNDHETRWRLYGVVTLEDGQYRFNNRPMSKGPARGAYVDSRHTRGGAGILHVTSNPEYTDEQQMFAAGYLEGWLTAERIHDHFHNMRAFFNMSTSKPVDWLVEQDRWARHQVADASNANEPVWAAVGAVLTQFDGLLAGYNDRAAASRAAAATDTAASAATAVATTDTIHEASINEGSAATTAAASDAEPAAAAAANGSSTGAEGAEAVGIKGTGTTSYRSEGSHRRHLQAPLLENFQRHGKRHSGRRSGSRSVRWFQQRFHSRGDGGGSADVAAARPELPALSRADLLLVSGVGDLGDLVPALDKSMRPAWHSMGPSELQDTLAARGKCSALVKIAGDLSDLYMAHSSWYTYAAMQRIYKHYDLQLSNPSIQLRRQACSSYAGELSSDDDFYLLDTGLTVLQTTNDILDESLYDLLTPQSLTSWQRVRAANMVATTGAEWARAIDVHQSGTCNNQYMVVDRKQFQPQQELKAGLLTVVEQIPGLTVSSDETRVLQFGFWPSYNVPYFPEIYDKSGYKSFRATHGARGRDYQAAVEGLSYQLAPRADLFRRDEGTVLDVQGLQALMRSNYWQNDTQYSRGSSLNAICGRGDVNSPRPQAYGCYDTKATNWHMAAELQSLAVVGPPVQDGMKPFRWSEAPPALQAVPHKGQPDVYDFRFQLMTPQY